MQNTIEIRPDGLYLSGERTLLVSGDFHYFRTLPGGWARRLALMKDFGLTAVTTYVAWNLHEPQPGTFCFDGIADLPRFLAEAQRAGLYVILRCSPYMCAEWEMGGLPWWLLNTDAAVRTSDPTYMAAVRAYNRVLCEKVRPYLYTNGGPVILVGLENEYGSFGNDLDYLRALADDYRKNGIDVPFVSANGADPFKYYNGSLPENWNGVDANAGPGGLHDLEVLRTFQPDKPLMAGEAWVGWIQFCEKEFSLNGNIEPAAEYFRAALKMGAAVNFYMFCGGTNFGFTSGSLDAPDADGKFRFSPLVTSYDYDAPVSEEGTPREKYFALRDVLDEFLGKPARPHTAPPHPVQTIDAIALPECAPLLPNLDCLTDRTVQSAVPRTMEHWGQGTGMICYTTRLAVADPRRYHLHLEGLADRATVYLNGAYLGTVMRDRPEPDIVFSVPEGGAELTILVENLGRIDYGYHIYDRKGLTGVRFDIQRDDGTYIWNLAACTGFTIRTMPLPGTAVAALPYGGESPAPGCPAVYRGTFAAQPGVDTFLDLSGWTKGIVWVNGFNLGRYWTSSPQRTLYVPGELLRETNTIEVLELHRAPAPCVLAAIDHSRLTEPVTDGREAVAFAQT